MSAKSAKCGSVIRKIKFSVPDQGLNSLTQQGLCPWIWTPMGAQPPDHKISTQCLLIPQKGVWIKHCYFCSRPSFGL